MVKTLVKKGLVHVLQTLFAFTSETIKADWPSRSALVIAPHPDDETLACGATILRLREQGVRVRLVLVTDGCASAARETMRPAQLARLRQNEMQKAARLLGVPETDIVFLAYPDGQAAAHRDQIKQDLAAQIWLCSPEWIFAPYSHDAHPDHRAIGEALEALCKAGKISCRILAYPMWYWPRLALKELFHAAPRRKISTRGFLEHKALAMGAYHSQTGALASAADLDEAFLQQNLCAYEWFFDVGPVS